MRDEQRLDNLIQVVEHNTAAVTRFTETQDQFHLALVELREEIRNGHQF
jgi:hypothetical protein